MTKQEAAKLQKGDKVKFKDGTMVLTVKELKEDAKGYRVAVAEMNIYPLHKKLERV